MASVRATTGDAEKLGMSITTKDRRWELLHSLWIGWTFTIGVFNWIAFVYIGLRAGQRKWILWGVLYLMPVTLVIVLAGAGASAGLGAIAMLLMVGSGVASIFHAFRVRNEYLLRLVALQRRVAESDEALKRRFSDGVDREEESRWQGTATPGETRRSPPHPDLEETGTYSNQQPRVHGDHPRCVASQVCS